MQQRRLFTFFMSPLVAALTYLSVVTCFQSLYNANAWIHNSLRQPTSLSHPLSCRRKYHSSVQERVLVQGIGDERSSMSLFSISSSSSSSSTEKELEGESSEPQRNLDRPELPELKGDYDWDAKFRNDADWITEQVPGKVVLNEVELASQISALEKLEAKWRKQREMRESQESQNVGFVETAEMINGRTAMFFLVTGLLTEYWTGYSMPAQVEEMLRVGGFIGFD